MKYFALSVVVLLACIGQLEAGVAVRLNCSNTNPCRDFFQELPAPHFREPLSLESNNGYLPVTLTAQMSEVTVQWLKLKRRTFNGRMEAPTWKVFPGDRVEVRLRNNLGPNPVNETGFNTLHKPNTTNIHTHGLHISPEGNADNVFVEIDPGQEFHYDYRIHDEHPAGTFWYHPHFHGSGLFQTMSGMSGLIIVQDYPNRFRVPRELIRVSCPDFCQHDIEMLMQPTLQYSADAVPVVFGDIQQEIQDDPLFMNREELASGGTLGDWLVEPENRVDYFTANGQLHPVMKFRPGQMKRMRFANAGGAHALEIEVRGVGHNNNCTIREIAFDGVYLDAPRVPRTGQTLVVPGGRADWMIRCDHPGKYAIVSIVKAENNPSMGTFDRHNGTLATISVEGRRVFRPLGFPTWLPLRADFMRDLQNLGPWEEVQQFVIEMGPANTLNREFLQQNKSLQNRYSMKLGTIQEWTFVNANPVLLHPMHIHVNHYQVISYNRYRGPVSTRQVIEQGEDFRVNDVLVDQTGSRCQFQWSGYDPNFPSNQTGITQNDLQYIGHEVRYVSGEGALAYAPVGDWRETISVPALANITIRFIPSHFTGKKVIHCHNSAHGDRGMFIVAEVVRPYADLPPARIASNGNLAGTCHPGDWYPGISTLPSTIAPPSSPSGVLTLEQWVQCYYPQYLSLLRNNWYFRSIFQNIYNHLSLSSHIPQSCSRNFFGFGGGGGGVGRVGGGGGAGFAGGQVQSAPGRSLALPTPNLNIPGLPPNLNFPPIVTSPPTPAPTTTTVHIPAWKLTFREWLARNPRYIQLLDTNRPSVKRIYNKAIMNAKAEAGRG